MAGMAVEIRVPDASANPSPRRPSVSGSRRPATTSRPMSRWSSSSPTRSTIEVPAPVRPLTEIVKQRAIRPRSARCSATIEEAERAGAGQESKRKAGEAARKAASTGQNPEGGRSERKAAPGGRKPPSGDPRASPAPGAKRRRKTWNSGSVQPTARMAACSRSDVQPSSSGGSEATGPRRHARAARRAERARAHESNLRRTIAARLVDAQQSAALLTTFNEVDMSAVHADAQACRTVRGAHGVKLGFMAFFVQGLLPRAEGVPRVNAQIDGDDIVYFNYYDIGIAVGSEKGSSCPSCAMPTRLSLRRGRKTIADFGRAPATAS